MWISAGVFKDDLWVGMMGADGRAAMHNIDMERYPNGRLAMKESWRMGLMYIRYLRYGV